MPTISEEIRAEINSASIDSLIRLKETLKSMIEISSCCRREYNFVCRELGRRNREARELLLSKDEY